MAATDFSRQLSQELGNARDTLAWISNDTNRFRHRYAPVAPPVPVKSAETPSLNGTAMALESEKAPKPPPILPPPPPDWLSEKAPRPDWSSENDRHPDSLSENTPKADWASDKKRAEWLLTGNSRPMNAVNGQERSSNVSGEHNKFSGSNLSNEASQNKPLAAILQESINSSQLRAPLRQADSKETTNADITYTATPLTQANMPVSSAAESKAGGIFTVEGHMGRGLGVVQGHVWTPPSKPSLRSPIYSMSLGGSFDSPGRRSPSPGISHPGDMSSSYMDGHASRVHGGSLVFGRNGSTSRAGSELGSNSTIVRSLGLSREGYQSPFVGYQRPVGVGVTRPPLAPVELPQLQKATVGRDSGYIARFRQIAEAVAGVQLPETQQWPMEREQLRALGLMTSPEDRLREQLARFSQTLLKVCVDVQPLGPDGERFKRDVWVVANALQEHLENNCAKCGQPIGGGRPGCSALDKTYHLECFTCTVCNGRLAGGSFYSVDGKPYCEKDYMETLEKCNVCQKPIMDRILRASGKPYHPQCFTCTACGKSLDGVPFTVDSNNAIHCVDCFHEKYAPRCARCSKPIVPEEGKEESLRVVAMDKSFHVDCYRCEDCNKSLNSKIDGHGCYPLDDHILCKECNMARVQAMSK